MSHDHAQSAMTEVALALAMAFFAIMVLAMISMGSSVQANKTQKADTSVDLTDIQLSLQALQPDQKNNQPNPSKETIKTVGPDDVLVVFYQGQWFDRTLAPLNPENLSTDKPVILALDPDLPLNKAIAARSQLARSNITIAPLDRKWLTTLETIQNGDKR